MIRLLCISIIIGFLAVAGAALGAGAYIAVLVFMGGAPS
jgi:hypothetical protein